LQEVIAGGDVMKGQERHSNQKDFHYIFMPETLPASVTGGESDQNIFPEDPLERCNLRWHQLFWGIWRSLDENDRHYRKIKLGIIEALKKCGLFGGKNFPSELFELNPTDEILRRTAAFYKTPWIHDVRGKKLPWEGYDPLIALFDYSSTFFILHDVKPRFRNPDAKYLAIKERLPEILKKVRYKVRDDVPKDILRSLIKHKVSKRELTVRLVAYIHGLKQDAFRKRLSAARKEYPDLDKLWRKNGMKMIES
jgi:hypothetical protein